MTDFQSSFSIVIYLISGTLGIAALMTWLLKRMK
jgi:hypothetical protein